MRFIASILPALLLVCLFQPPARAEWPTRIDKAVAPGRSVVLMSLRQYQDARGCTPTPAGPIDGDPKPKLGVLSSTDRVVVSDGPCGRMGYPVQLIEYKAGNTSGVDEFELYIFPTAFWGGSPWRIKTKIMVGTVRQEHDPAKISKQTENSGKIQQNKINNEPQRVKGQAAGLKTQQLEESAGDANRKYTSKLYGLIVPLIRVPQGAKGKPLKLEFVVDPRGRLVGSIVVKSSDVEAIDNAALVALRRAAPFPPPPSGKAIGLVLDYSVPSNTKGVNFQHQHIPPATGPIFEPPASNAKGEPLSNMATRSDMPQLPIIKRNLSVIKGETVRAGYAYSLNKDCSPDGEIHMNVVTEPQAGKIRIVKENGFTSYASTDVRAACNQAPTEVVKIYYDAASIAGTDSFATEAFYANGNSRRFEFSISIR